MKARMKNHMSSRASLLSSRAKRGICGWVLAFLPLAAAGAQQKVDIRNAAAPTVSVRLSGAISSVRVIAWQQDSIALTGALGPGSRMDGGPSRIAGPVTGMKFWIEAADEAALRGNRLELRVPRNASVWIKTGSADIDVQGVAGTVDLNIVGGSVTVTGKPRELIVESMDGAVSYTGWAEYAKVKTATGDITLNGGGEDLSFTTVSGTINASNPERDLKRLRLESVTGPISWSGTLPRGADVRCETHSGAVDIRFASDSRVEIDAASVLGTIENAWNATRPVAGREGRGMELGTSSGMGSARVLVRSFKGSIRFATR
jgi:DUF4097 and DUF4098 domain-containing protein YvlB